MGRRVRSFIAVPLPEELKAELAGLQKRLQPQLPGVRWAAPETIHLTLSFLGDVAEEVLEKVPKVMLSVARCHPTFSARAVGIGAFPDLQRARVIWIGLDDGAALSELQQDLAKGLAALGLSPEDRAFHPHLTLGRCRTHALPVREILAPYRESDCGRFPVERIVLYESRLAPSGALHLQRAVIPLGGRGDEACGHN